MNQYHFEKAPNDGVKEGERFKDKRTGKVYVVRTVFKEEVLLQGEDGRGRRFTGLKNLETTCYRLADNVSKG